MPSWMKCLTVCMNLKCLDGWMFEMCKCLNEWNVWIFYIYECEKTIKLWNVWYVEYFNVWIFECLNVCIFRCLKRLNARRLWMTERFKCLNAIKFECLIIRNVGMFNFIIVQMLFMFQ